MNRNVESHFAKNPTRIDINRSTFTMDHSVKTSFNVGDIIPIMAMEILPGDTIELDTSKVVRMQPLVAPIMDNLYLDTYTFFVPNRLLWIHWQEFMGENTESAWIPQSNYTIPQIKPPSGGWNVGTIADYLGFPTGVAGYTVSALPFRAYALIVSDWFRDENLSDPLNIPVTDSTVTGSNGGTFVTDVAKGGLPYKAAKYHDYFTSCLPAPQKGPDVTIPLGTTAPVVGQAGLPMVFERSDRVFNTNRYSSLIGLATDPSQWPTDTSRAFGPGSMLVTETTASDDELRAVKASGTLLNTPIDGVYQGVPYTLSYHRTQPSNIVADLSAATSASINSLRLAFQIQKLYERDARGGSRYIEILKSHFGVTSPDSRLQRPEYLGGNRVPININQVVQTSETSNTPQGNTAAYSLTADTHSDFTHSFVEHGILMTLAVVRYDHTYQQGIHRSWSRKTRFDYYFPALANIGEQPVLNKEIYAQGTDDDSGVFGYQEAWAEYRYFPNIVTGEMRSTYATSLDSWHLGDEYSSLPYLSDSWIREDNSNVDRVLAVQSSVSNQLFGDFFFKMKATRAMPMYSIPGLMDHH